MTTAVAPKQVEVESEPRVYHWTAENFYQAAAAGVFEDPGRLELIHGRIIEKMPLSPLHADVADCLADCLSAVLSPKFRVREEKPIHLALDAEPVPDISVVHDRSYRQQHPTSEQVILLVEVAVSSVEYDLGEKALLYAQAGIIEYWVALPEEMLIVVHRDPAPDGYQSVTRLGMDAQISPVVASGTWLSVRDLLGSATAQD